MNATVLCCSKTKLFLLDELRGSSAVVLHVDSMTEQLAQNCSAKCMLQLLANFDK